MQSTWSMSQCPAGVATGHGADKLQTAAPNAGLCSKRAHSPFSPSYLSPKYPQVAFHSLDHVSRSDGTKAHTVASRARPARRRPGHLMTIIARSAGTVWSQRAEVEVTSE